MIALQIVSYLEEIVINYSYLCLIQFQLQLILEQLIKDVQLSEIIGLLLIVD